MIFLWFILSASPHLQCVWAKCVLCYLMENSGSDVMVLQYDLKDIEHLICHSSARIIGTLSKTQTYWMIGNLGTQRQLWAGWGTCLMSWSVTEVSKLCEKAMQHHKMCKSWIRARTAAPSHLITTDSIRHLLYCRWLDLFSSGVLDG